MHIHKWGQWTKVRVDRFLWKDGTISYDYRQQRTCTKCNLKKERMI